MSTTAPDLVGIGRDDATRACLVALAGLEGIGPATLLACATGEGAVAVWTALVAGRAASVEALARRADRRDGLDLDRLARAARGVDPTEVLARNRADGRRVLVPGDDAYPDRLSSDPAPPAVLFAQGALGALERPTVAVVGTRTASRLGRDLARDLGATLAAHGVGVVSGLASGIDAAAHVGALGPTDPDPAAQPTGRGEHWAAPIGVVASGLDIAYPVGNRLLQRRVGEAGLLVSETPAGHRPSRWRFPARNRIIAALADAVVVVESRSAGGSMLTAAEALERGVPVLAVPGHPTSPVAAGANDLIFDGATPVRSADDVLMAIGVDAAQAPIPGLEGAGRAAAGRVDRPSALLGDPVAQAILEHLDGGPATLGELANRCAASLDEVALALARLEGEGLIATSGGWFERRLPSGAGSRGAGGDRR